MEKGKKINFKISMRRGEGIALYIFIVFKVISYNFHIGKNIYIYREKTITYPPIQYNFTPWKEQDNPDLGVGIFVTYSHLGWDSNSESDEYFLASNLKTSLY